MQLSPECLDAVRYRAFWEDTEEPSLKKFLDFRLLAGDLEDKQTEYHRYKQELETIGKFYAEMSEPGQEVIRWKNAFKKSKQSTVISLFWKLQNVRQNIAVKNVLIEDKINMQENKAKAKVRKLQADQHVTIATVTTGQIQQYARSTTTKFLDEKERTIKRARTYKESDNNDNTENNHLLLSDEKSSTVSIQDQFSPNDKSSDDESEDDGDHVDYKIDDDSDEFSNSSLLGRNDAKGTQTPPHQITGNTSFAQSSANETHESILRASSENLTGLNEAKYFKEFISLFEEYKEREKNNVYSCTNDDVMDIRGDGGFAKFLTIEQYTKLLSLRPKRRAVLPNGWREVIEEYYKESLTEDGPKKTIRLVMLPLIESFLKPIPDISASNSSEHHYWAEFGHRFFSYALQEFAGLDWRAMEVPVLASKYRKNYELDHSLYKVVEGKCADLLAWSWETKEEIFVGEQAGPPTKPDLTKLFMDSFKLYRELRDCVNVRILNAMKIGDVNYTNRAVFGILGYLFEIKMLIMWKDEFITELKYTAKIENDNDKVQVLKRKFSDFIQTKPSPIKVAKVKR
ncbi:hypothetical protein GLOIN_2v1716154 [Rhizophagus clarus]|uniref:Uncharacterized protein n=1 Tax=Rhizophagus clarus TaxID=94130 RepID=A0A8H3QL25_9GLOM|nr:hypothetical protein GLOIN_2v1716154 [Rhizophagus clarus]